jgi:hypothetical protein
MLLCTCSSLPHALINSRKSFMLTENRKEEHETNKQNDEDQCPQSGSGKRQHYRFPSRKSLGLVLLFRTMCIDNSVQSEEICNKRISRGFVGLDPVGLTHDW